MVVDMPAVLGLQKFRPNTSIFLSAVSNFELTQMDDGVNLSQRPESEFSRQLFPCRQLVRGMHRVNPLR